MKKKKEVKENHVKEEKEVKENKKAEDGNN